METPIPKRNKILYYALWPIYWLVAFILDTTGEWWQKLLE
jgi:hypothetical protein